MPQLRDARAPEGLRLYAIGDVHGRLDLLREMHARIGADLVRRPCRAFRVIHLGDYIDRGPDSAGVIAHLIEFAQDGDAACLCGNHDLYPLSFLQDPGKSAEHWFAYGGLEALASYGVDAFAPGLGLRSAKAVRKAFASALPPEHLAFLRGLSFMERQGDYLFVHAGLRPKVRIEKQKIGDLVMIREPFLSHEGDFGAVVVHGHTVSPEPVIRANRVGLDTKAYATGLLSCLVLEDVEKGLLTASGYAPLTFDAA